MKIISIGFIDIAEEVFQKCPLIIICKLIIGPIHRSRVKAAGISGQRFRVDAAGPGAIGHALGVGEVKELRQGSKGGFGVQLAVLEAHQDAVPVESIPGVHHKAAVEHAGGQVIGHNTPFFFNLRLHEANGRGIAGGGTADGGEGLDVFEVLEHSGGTDAVVLLRVEHGLVALRVH